ncbi:MAG: YicC/YloC family endoribonuclease [Rhizobiaceae bacterium]
MSLQSMTGFARSSRTHGDTQIVWELKSVNGKSADIRLRLPPGYERLEQPVRKAVQRCFTRGSIFASLALSRRAAVATPVVNEEFLKDVAGLAKRLEAQFGCRPASADGLLALRGVLEAPGVEDDEEAVAALDAEILAGFEAALADLQGARSEEGSALVKILLDHVSKIEALTEAAEDDPSREAVAIRERLQMQIAPLLEDTALDEGRLYQEAVFLAAKADIREEIDRLKAHVASARNLLSGDTAVGRKLDFLAQEFNRESNTLCSKSNAAAITTIGLELKAVVDQFREQVQNLE